MEKKSVIKIGLLAILAIVIFVWGLSFLKGDSLFKAENYYVAVYDRLDGLSESNPVMLSGYKIGSVHSIGFEDVNNELKIIVKLKINSDFKIPKGTIVKIVSVDIMGTKGVDVLRPNNFESYCDNGDTLTAAVDGGILDQMLELILPMKDELAGFLHTSDSVMHSLNLLLNEKNRGHLASSLENLEELSSHLASNVNNIDNMIKNFDNLSKTIGKNTGTIDRAINNFASFSDTLSNIEFSTTLANAQTALQNFNQLLSTVSNNDGTVQKLLTSDSVYNNLENMTSEINKLIDEFQKHPKKYINLSIFGGRDKSYKYENQKKQK